MKAPAIPVSRSESEKHLSYFKDALAKQKGLIRRGNKPHPSYTVYDMDNLNKHGAARIKMEPGTVEVVVSSLVDAETGTPFRATCVKDTSVSSTYVSYAFTLEDDFCVQRGVRNGLIEKKIPKGATVVITNLREAKKAGSSIRPKQLTPASLGIAKDDQWMDKPTFSERVYEAARTSLEKSNRDYVKFLPLLKGLVDVVATNSSAIEFGEELKKLAEPMADPDMGVIAKDFGEVLSAHWMMHNRGVDSVKFPVAANEPLVDFYVMVDNEQRGVSAKSKDGAAPSIKSVYEAMQKFKCLTPAEQRAADMISMMHNSPAISGMFEMGDELKLSEWADLKNHEKTESLDFENLTNRGIRDWMREMGEEETVEFLRTNWLDKIPSAVTEETIRFVMKDKSLDARGLFSAPLATKIYQTFNKDESMIAFLNKVMTSIDVLQVYINLSKTDVKFRVCTFEDAFFQFYFAGSPKYPGTAKLSFKMMKKKKMAIDSIPITLDEAINHCDEKSREISGCAKDHQQLAAWLKELKELRAMRDGLRDR